MFCLGDGRPLCSHSLKDSYDAEGSGGPRSAAGDEGAVARGPGHRQDHFIGAAAGDPSGRPAALHPNEWSAPSEMRWEKRRRSLIANIKKRQIMMVMIKV